MQCSSSLTGSTIALIHTPTYTADCVRFLLLLDDPRRNFFLANDVVAGDGDCKPVITVQLLEKASITSDSSTYTK
jgi:hypothetical protein